jgi:hypothetical protein
MKIVVNNDNASLITKIAVVASVFPYNSLFLLFPTDIQPFTIIATLLDRPSILISSLSSYAIFATFCLSLFHVDLSIEMLYTVRSVLGYFSALIIFNYWASAKESQIAILAKVVKVAIIVYFGSAILNLIFIIIGQEEIFQSVASIFKSRAAVVSGNRGVTGIVPEPSFLSLTVYLLFLISFLIKCDNRLTTKETAQELLPVVITSILTYSGTTLFLYCSIIISSFLSLGSKFITLLLNQKYLLRLVVYLVLFRVIIILTSTESTNSSGGTRLEIILNNFIQNGFSSLLNDASIFDRFWAVYSPFASLSKNIFGYGTSGYISFMNLYNLGEDPIYALGVSNNVYQYITFGKLMNLFGNYLIDFGWLGALSIVCFLLSINYQISRSAPQLKKMLLFKKRFIFISTTLVCLQAIPVSHPLPWLLFGLLVNPLIQKIE